MWKDTAIALTTWFSTMVVRSRWSMGKWWSRVCYLGRGSLTSKIKVFFLLFSFCLWQEKSYFFINNIWTPEEICHEERPWSSWFHSWNNIWGEARIFIKVLSLYPQDFSQQGLYSKGVKHFLRGLEWYHYFWRGGVHKLPNRYAVWVDSVRSPIAFKFKLPNWLDSTDWR